jgi:hypothetical protein
MTLVHGLNAIATGSRAPGPRVAITNVIGYIPSMEEGALILADCLGFRGIWNRIDPEKLINKLQSTEKEAAARVVPKYSSSMLSFGPVRFHLRLLPNLKLLRQSLFNICTKVCRTLEKSDPKKLSGESKAILPQLHAAFDASRTSTGKLDIDAYIRKVAPRLNFWAPGNAMEGRKIALYELIEAFKNLVAVYSNFTSPLLNTLAEGLRQSASQPEAASLVTDYGVVRRR